MFLNFNMQPFHRSGRASRGLWISGGSCEFSQGRASMIKVYRLVEGKWVCRAEVPPEDNYELQQMMFAATERRREEKIFSQNKISD